MKSFFDLRENKQITEASREDKIKQTIKIMKKYPANKGKSEKELRKGAIAYLDQKKESVDEASLKTSDYPKGTSMSAQKFKDSQKKMSKQRALSTKDYPKGTSMSATAWKNKQEEVEVDEASILRTKTTRKQSDASKEKDRKKAVKTFQDIRKGKYPGVKFAEETLDEASIQDIQGILTTIAKSQNMNQAVQMVMKKYKVDQGKAKAMVKKAIDSGVTYDKIKKKYAK